MNRLHGHGGPSPGRMNARNVVEQAIGEKLDRSSLNDPNTGKEAGMLNATPVELGRRRRRPFACGWVALRSVGRPIRAGTEPRRN